ncbi:MAG: bis(5'-nucleosyl)-tetraphosphatase (symmetrical) YqeK [Dethiobacteria bacterium]|nr:bis(5'-nucleosyl)-tetraphosphatase (symmetrical) YqeK [Dethiobacteria bacterium]
MKPDQCRKLMQELLNDELYRHSLGVSRAAVVLAERFGADVEKAELAGLLHDYGKRYSHQELLEKADRLNLMLDDLTRREGKLLHAPVGAALLNSELQITEADLAEAVSDHTTGRCGMGVLGKVLYLADYIEENRNFEGVEKIRQLASIDFDQALLAAVNNAIRSVLARNLILHPRSVEFRNCLLVAIGGNDNQKKNIGGDAD